MSKVSWMLSFYLVDKCKNKSDLKLCMLEVYLREVCVHTMWVSLLWKEQRWLQMWKCTSTFEWVLEYVATISETRINLPNHYHVSEENELY